MTLPFFDTLPLHPQPEQWEAFTGYVSRVARLNGVRSANEMKQLCFPGQTVNERVFNRLDYTTVSLQSLSKLTVCPEPVLRSLQCLHLGTKFEAELVDQQSITQRHKATSYTFLYSSFAQTLRYCPHCIEGRPYSLLPWRFEDLPGCLHHKCRLLNGCGRCQYRIPLLALLTGGWKCPACEMHLYQCSTVPLDSEDMELSALYLRDLEYMLKPASIDYDPASLLQMVGKRLRRRRDAAGLTYADIAPLIRASEHQLQSIEDGVPMGQKTSFKIYQHYVYYLGTSLSDLFNPMYDEQIFSNVLLASYHTASSVAKVSNIVAKAIRESERDQMKQNDQLPKVRTPLQHAVLDAVRLLLCAGEVPIADAVSQIVNVPSQVLHRDRVVRTLLIWAITTHHSTKDRASRRVFLQRFLQTLEELHASKTPSSIHSIAAHLDSTSEQLLRERQLHNLFIQATRLRYLECMLDRYERQLVTQVRRLVAAYRTRGEAVSWAILVQHTGIALSGLQQYSQVRTLMAEVSNANTPTLGAQQSEAADTES